MIYHREMLTGEIHGLGAELTGKKRGRTFALPISATQ
jgi:hypothetical protein